MNMRTVSHNKQGGALLLEALVAILIFSMGILAIVGLQAASIKSSSEAKYRSDAGQLTNQLIAQMWVSDRTAGTLQTNFSSPAGAAYQAWLPDVTAALPGAAANPPTVTVAQVTGPNATSSLVTVTVFWQAPGEAAGTPPHKYVAVAQII